MTMSLHPSDLEGCNLKSSTTWDPLYHLLRTWVRYLVCSSHVSLWRGQEEEVIADIVQEAITRTFSKYSSRGQEEGEVTCDSLQRTSFLNAYQCYQDLRRRDYRFVRAPLRRSSPERHVVIY